MTVPIPSQSRLSATSIRVSQTPNKPLIANNSLVIGLSAPKKALGNPVYGGKSAAENKSGAVVLVTNIGLGFECVRVDIVLSKVTDGALHLNGSGFAQPDIIELFGRNAKVRFMPLRDLVSILTIGSMVNSGTGVPRIG